MKLNLSLFTTAGGVAAATVLVIVCAAITLVTVDLPASSNPQRSLDWLLGSEPGQSTTRQHLPPPSQIAENATTGVGSQQATAPEFVETAPIAEPVPASGDGDHAEMVETVDSAPSPGDESADWESREAIPAPESSVEEFVVESWGRQSGADSTEWSYGVCLLVTMGRTGARSQRRALPYSELYRLFDAAKSWKEEKIFVGTNSDPTVFCKMVRDALGPSAECANFNSVGVATNKYCKRLVVGATESFTPQPSSIHIQKHGFQWERMETVDLDAEDPAREPPSLPESEWRPTIVTAFSSNHVEVGLLLLRSLGRVAAQQREFNVSVVVWTMNQFPARALQALSCVVKELQTVYNVQAEVRAFDFTAWPAWMHIDQKKGYKGGRGEYAWKAIMIHTVLVERGFVYWADAGDRFKSVAGLTETLRIVQQKGFASRHSSGRVKDWTHPMQLEYFNANSGSIRKQPNCDASGIGFTLKSYRKLVRPWYECSITRQCIAPDGSSRKNHRQDQSALTVLVILAGAKCEGVNSGIMKNMDSQRNGYRVGVDATKCYKDPLNIKWQRKLM